MPISMCVHMCVQNDMCVCASGCLHVGVFVFTHTCQGGVCSVFVLSMHTSVWCSHV